MKWLVIHTHTYNSIHKHDILKVNCFPPFHVFPGRCPFQQYMPSKPGKYGIKLWTACDARSGYAWNMQVYTGKPAGGTPERKQGKRVVLEMTEGLRGHNVTCDNFFTSYELGQELLKKMTMVGTVRRNKPELPPTLVTTRGREVFSSKFAFTHDTTVVSYMPKKNKNVILMSTLHKAAEISTREDRKPTMILEYNANKGGVDNLDKVAGTYSCKRRTTRWPLAIFHNIIDISTYNSFVIWRELNPTWRASVRNWRRHFLEELGKALVTPCMQKRQHLPRTAASAALVRAVQPPQPGTGTDVPHEDNRRGQKRKRCNFCPPKKHCKTGTTCCKCRKHICKAHTHKVSHYCFECTQ